jgi:hypothetical protein
VAFKPGRVLEPDELVSVQWADSNDEHTTWKVPVADLITFLKFTVANGAKWISVVVSDEPAATPVESP